MKVLSYSISALGDSALIVDFGNLIEESINRRVLAVCAAFKATGLAGIRDIVPAYSSVTVHYDTTKIAKTDGESAFETVKRKLEAMLVKQTDGLLTETRKVRIPVCYTTKYGLDLEDVALHAKMTVEEVVQLHTSRKYRVYMVGFLPGFAYMGEVDERIALSRKSEPRMRLVAGSVGIAGKQTGIYPLTSPGGWQIIGRTPVKLFDKNKAIPALFAAGDEVTFFSITEDEFNNY